jgi:HD-GYP domain-containing protein (c-di-GMP phosphodiesterase class II)
MEKTSGNLDRKLLLELVTEQVATLLDAEESSIILMASEDKNNSLRVTTKRDTSQLNIMGDTQTPAIKTEFVSEKGPRQARTLNAHNLGTGFLSNSTVVRPLNTQALPANQEQADPDQSKITGVLMAHNKQDGFFDDEDAQFLDIIANQASSMLLISKLYDDNNDLFIDVITALVAAIDAKDPYTQGHSKRVSDLSVAIGKTFDFSETDLRNLQIGSLLHDVGKIGVPDQILQKPSKLTPEEYQLIKQHPAIGKNIMGQVKMLSEALPAIAEHHERLDGSGYPYALKGKEISLIGRIVAVADVFDALTSDRPYRKAQTYTEALEYLRSRKWAIYDQWCVEALVDLVKRNKRS